MTDAPIQVNASPLPDQLWAGVRQVAPPLLAFGIGRHIIPDDAAPLLGALGLMLWPIIAGQLATRERAKQLAVTAEAAPDSVATVK